MPCTTIHARSQTFGQPAFRAPSYRATRMYACHWTDASKLVVVPPDVEEVDYTTGQGSPDPSAGALPCRLVLLRNSFHPGSC